MKPKKLHRLGSKLEKFYTAALNATAEIFGIAHDIHPVRKRSRWVQERIEVEFAVR
jgi:hypothetical protein